MTEYLDILQTDGTPTGERKSRSDIHADGDWHATVHVYLFRERDGQLELLVHLRSPYKDRHPNAWDTRFGGHVKSGETCLQAVASELSEEIGLDATTLELIAGPRHQHDDPTNREFTYSYYARYDGDVADLKFNDGEVQEIAWITPDAIVLAMEASPASWVSSPVGFKKFLEELHRNI